jgi:Na+-transporting methylmalonyl-CoA/oxaloacetate decarboxylase beta subunit
MKLSDKALKIISAAGGIFTLSCLFCPAVIKFIIISKMKKTYNINHASSIGIIGGADGPTAIFISNRNHALKYIILTITSIITVISFIILIIRKIKIFNK